MISRVFSGAVLILALITSLATSSPSFQRAFVAGTYQVKSDCPNALAEGQLQISIDTSSPTSGEAYQLNNGIAFGFPSNLLMAGRVRNTDLSGNATVQEGERECKALLWETAENSGLFVCHRGNDLECTIHLQKI